MVELSDTAVQGVCGGGPRRGTVARARPGPVPGGTAAWNRRGTGGTARSGTAARQGPRGGGPGDRWHAPPPTARRWRLAAVSGTVGLAVAAGGAPPGPGHRAAGQGRARADRGGTGGERHPGLRPQRRARAGRPRPRRRAGRRRAPPRRPPEALADALEPLLEDATWASDALVRRRRRHRQAPLRLRPRDAPSHPPRPSSWPPRAAGPAGPRRRPPDRDAGGRGGDGGQVVLVGGGDPTLTAGALRKLPPARPWPTRTGREAAQEGVRRSPSVRHLPLQRPGLALHRQRTTTSPPSRRSWSTRAGSTTATTAPPPRSSDPAADAAGGLRRALRERGVEVTATRRQGDAAARGAGHRSAAAVRRWSSGC